MIVDTVGIWIYSYTGRLHLSPRYSGSQTQIPTLIRDCVSLGLDHMAVRDAADQCIIHVFDLLPGASRQDEPYAIKSRSVVVEVSVSKAGHSDNQYLIFVDVNRDLYITLIQNGPDFIINKIGKHIQ